MKTNIFAIVVSVVVGIIMIGSLLAPVVADATTSMTTTVYSNEQASSWNVALLDDENEHSITYTGGTLTIDDKTYYSYSWTNAVVVSNHFAMYSVNGVIQLVPPGGELGFYGNTDTITATVTTSSITYKINDADAVTVSIDWVFLPNENGNYVYYGDLATTPAYISNLNQLYAYTFGSPTGVAVEEGAITFNSQPFVLTATTTDVADGVMKISQWQLDGGSMRANALVPTEIVIVTENSSADLLAIIPLIAIIGLLIGVVRIIFTNRD